MSQHKPIDPKKSLLANLVSDIEPILGDVAANIDRLEALLTADVDPIVARLRAQRATQHTNGDK